MVYGNDTINHYFLKFSTTNINCRYIFLTHETKVIDEKYFIFLQREKQQSRRFQHLHCL